MYAGITLVMALLLTRPINIPVAGICAVDYLTIENTMPSKQTTSSEEYTLTDEEFDYLCRCIEAEAGDQDYLGKCYVADVILNRVDNKGFPNDVIAVINETHKRKDGKICYQFETVLNGRIWTVEVTEETRQAVREELKNRKDYEMLYFCMYRWFDGWAEYMFTHPKDRSWNCHHFYKEKRKE